MKRTTIIAALIAALFSISAQAQKGSRAEVLFESARQKETLEGDLKGAIRQYEEIVARHSDRAVAARALIAMAECHQKLGDVESRKIYERVLREYADQREAVATARARLGPDEAVASAQRDRLVWTGPEVDMFGRISPDGRYLTYVDWFQTGNLMAHDMVSGADHALTKKKSWDDGNGQALYSSISRDGNQVVYEWLSESGNYDLILAAFHGSMIGERRRLIGSTELKSVRPFDWSPDGQLIAVHVSRVDRTSQIGLVTVKDGSLRVLRSVDWRGPSNMCFSNDGRFLAYDLPESDTTSKRDVYVLAIDGSRGASLVAKAADDTLVGISRDGRLLFASDRTGSMALWAQPFADGGVLGSPEMIKSDFGSPWIHGMTTSDALYVTKVVSDADVHFAPVDLAAGKLLAAPTGVQRFPSRGRPDWSADGKFLAYIDCGGFGGGPCTISIRDMETGQVREVRPPMHYFWFPRWSPDGRSFVTAGTDLKGRRGIYLIDSGTGKTMLVKEGRGIVADWSADSGRIFLTEEGKFIERELASGKEREIFSLSSLPPRDLALLKGCMSGTVSPDGKLLGCVTKEAVIVLPTGGGEARELFRVRPPESLVRNTVLSWTLGGGALVVTKRLTAGPQHLGGPRELWLVPVSSDAPRKLDIDSNGWDILNPLGARFSADGRQVAFPAGKGAMEVWALEGFLSSRNTKK